jgi:cytolethal distending toxin subunit B
MSDSRCTAFDAPCREERDDRQGMGTTQSVSVRARVATLRIATWNMQGSNQKDDSRWTTGVFQMMDRLSLDFMLLQECGAAPATAGMAPIRIARWLYARPAFRSACTYGAWPSPSMRRTLRPVRAKRIFHMEWDTSAGRCNLAIVSRTPPLSFIGITNPLKASERPLIGMSVSTAVGRLLVATLHAFSGNGNDGPGFLRAFSQLSRSASQPWLCAGDYNREPNSWTTANLPLDARLWNVNGITYPSSRRKLDYMWGSMRLRTAVGRVLPHPLSDHYPVLFEYHRRR